MTTPMRIILIGIIILIAGMIIFQQEPSPDSSPPNTFPTEDSFDLGPQTTGAKVIVQKITAAHNIWVVIHSLDQGQPGPVIAAKFFAQGMYENEEIELIDGTLQKDQTYYAGLRFDDGDNQMNIRTDLPATDNEGTIIMIPFTIN